MRLFAKLLTIILVTVSVALVLFHQDWLTNIWLWVVGLAGPAISFVMRLIELFRKYVGSSKSTVTK